LYTEPVLAAVPDQIAADSVVGAAEESEVDADVSVGDDVVCATRLPWPLSIRIPSIKHPFGLLAISEQLPWEMWFRVITLSLAGPSRMPA
jgi:hypothetical protein